MPRKPFEHGDLVYSYARMHYLEQFPFTPDRLALYASLLHAAHPIPAAVQYFFDTCGTLSNHTIRSVRETAQLIPFCRILKESYLRSNAACMGLSLLTTQPPDGSTDRDCLERIVLFCENENIPLLDAVLVTPYEAIPICRACGVQFYQFQTRKE